MMNFILMPAFVMITIVVYFTMKSAIKPRRNILFGVTLPTQALCDDAVLKIIDDYKRKINICNLVVVLTGLPTFFINREVLSITYFIIWSLVVAEWLVRQPYVLMNRKLTKLKKDKEWFIGEKRVVNMDTKISKLKDKMPLPDKYMLIPFGISLIPLIISIVKYDEDLKYTTFIAFILIGILVLLYFVGFIYTNNRIKSLEEELLKMDKEIIYTDDDEYWIDGYKYYNENDCNSKVNPRFGFNVYTYNLATKKGKLSYYSGLIICAVLLIPLCFNLLGMEFTNHKINISNESVSIDYPFYDYEFSDSDIEEIKLVDEVSFRLRTNGIGTDEYCRGSFKSAEYGKCRVYIYNKSKPYIIAKLKNNYFIYNEKTKDETMNVYYQLQELIKN